MCSIAEYCVAMPAGQLRSRACPWPGIFDQLLSHHCAVFTASFNIVRRGRRTWRTDLAGQRRIGRHIGGALRVIRPNLIWPREPRSGQRCLLGDMG